MSTPKFVRASQGLVFNQFMTREAISSAAFRPAEVARNVEPPKVNLRLHDETTHLKFGFPKTEKISEDDLRTNCQKLVKEEQNRQSAFSKMTSL